MPITKAFDRDVGIIDMHIGDIAMGNIRTISGYFFISSDLDCAKINLN
jgi:hypothetical protein